MAERNPEEVPDMIKNSILVESKLPDEAEKSQICGYDFNNGIDYDKIFDSYENLGIQSSKFSQACEIVNKMIDCKMSEQPTRESPIEVERDTNCVIFLGYTSNMVTSGVRDIIRYLCQHNMVDCLVTSGGGIEEDFIKCLGKMFLGDFTLSGEKLRENGINRAGNILIPNDNYCALDDWIMPILDQMLHEQNNNNVTWTPSKLIERLGKEINNEESIYYWAYKNKIPVFCPALTDGSIGDMLFVHSFGHPGLRLDIVEDVRRINLLSMRAHNTGMIILGGGTTKHHICNANLMRNGADFAVYVNTGIELDASDSGASPDEAVSWGKIRADGTSVKVWAEASLVFPIMIARTFARRKSEFLRHE